MIYRHLFSGFTLAAETLFPDKQRFGPSPLSRLPSILRVSPLCYREARPLLYQLCTFSLRDLDIEPPSPPMDRIHAPSTFLIQKLVIHSCTMCDNMPELGQLFPSLQHVTIIVFDQCKRRLTNRPPSPIKERIARRVLGAFDKMSIAGTYAIKTKPMQALLWTIVHDRSDHRSDWWILKHLHERSEFLLGRLQYSLRLQVDLTECVPWIKGRVSDEKISWIVGVYDPDEEEWTFDVNGRRVTIPEAIEDSWMWTTDSSDEEEISSTRAEQGSSISSEEDCSSES